MTDIVPVPNWGGVRQLETNEYATGGLNGNMNEQAKALAGQNMYSRLYAGLPFDPAFTAQVGGFPIGGKAALGNGDIVLSTIPNNTNNPNADITGWFKETKKGRIYVEQFNIGMELDIDPAKVFRRAIDYLVVNNIKNLWCGRELYYFADGTKESKKWTMPYDNGSLPASVAGIDAHGILPAEAQTEMNVWLTVPSDIIICSDNYRAVTFDFGWSFTSGDIDTNQTIGILRTCEGFDGTYTPSSSNKNRFNRFVRGGLNNITIKNAFIGEIADGVRFQDNLDTINYENCGIASITLGADNCKFKRMILQNCYAGFISGGWWLQRSSNGTRVYMPLGVDINAIGWNDAVNIDFMHYSLATDLNSIARMNLIDQFFDTYFYKSANNSTRLSTYRTPTTLTATSDIIPYTGVSSRGLWTTPRQKRNGTCNRVGQLKVYGSTRPPIYSFEEWEVDICFLERSGCVDRTSANNTLDNMYYASYTDQYLTNNRVFAAVIEQSDVSSINSRVLNVSRASSYNAPLVGSPNGTQRQWAVTNIANRQAFFEQTYNDRKELARAYSWFGLNPTTGAIRDHFNITPLHHYESGVFTWSSATLDNFEASGEVGFKTRAYPKAIVTPDNIVRVRVGSSAGVGVEYSLTGNISYSHDRTTPKAYINLVITAEVAALTGGLFIALTALPEPRATGSVTLGSQYPKVYPVRLPTVSSVEPKASSISVVEGVPYLRLSKDYANSATYNASDLAGAGTLNIILEYGTNPW